jgi:hypothetical protein
MYFSGHSQPFGHCSAIKIRRNLLMLVFWVVMPFGLVDVTSTRGPHGITTQKTNIDIFTAMIT